MMMTLRSVSRMASPIARPTRRKSSVSAGLADAHRDPLLVEALPEVAPQVHRRVVQGQVLVVDRSDPRAVRLALCGDRLGQLRIATPLVRDPAHSTGQLLGGEQPGPAMLRGDDELDGREPVRVEHDDRVVVEILELLCSESFQPRHDGELPALVQLQAGLPRKHDRWDMRQQARCDYFTHGATPSSSRSVRTPCSSHPRRSRRTRSRPRARSRSASIRRRGRTGRARRSS